MTVDSGRRLGPAARLDRATSDLDPPLAVLDLAALRANAADLVRRAGGKPIRLASKSIRCRTVLRQVLAIQPKESARCAAT
jgi:D-serine deaminase-like pyridoxal phosphate-dependent protein